jgi:hypothetical protein
MKLQYHASQTARIYDNGFIVHYLIGVTCAVKIAAQVFKEAING